ncbi:MULTISPECIES: relaxase/mobilization nuclease domain-containing protein [unclassified Ruminococcus]|uniref:relaxase/mobilization nuclease domain-containing protein n=1 Tax=unclassified Ruminococcus TaxID=2608920 RepID=UPI002109AEE0|nr:MULTISPECIES: relaxase/mobilization nuclease domain-containing protein [unclassified Ruminococcus]MCQ4022042.1 relaxase/mobilization nuclease domain-containing protein [Ruminococcus sp. zg-924]MCQ4114362.1 relaxase/mobilization nuclease domain-containing protein [Ruminococcus sp. zg-921]
MILTKKKYGKENGYIAWHGYQSFKPGEVTAKEAHEIGLQTARELWGDRYQIIVTDSLGILRNPNAEVITMQTPEKAWQSSYYQIRIKQKSRLKNLLST